MKEPVIPLIQADDPNVAVKTAEALKSGGLTTLEVVWRTDAAMDCMAAIVAKVADVTVGAGTVLTRAQAEMALDRGAQFIVSPGLDDGVVDVCQSNSIEIYPGVATATEVQRAWNMGLRTVKFFPASLSGGVPMLKALSSVFRGMRFMPTGGVSAANLADFLSLPSVVACGGSWLTPKSEIAAGNFDEITALAKDALAIAQTAKTKF
ncbi:MAG: bifunctional 4-hydroxy-2-oxoglutarate aldolase/2-dehydro-3-deoxy-phosphogluconate aldolase [Pseudomonadota bacterium]